jgi:hypothetical protein
MKTALFTYITKTTTGYSKEIKTAQIIEFINGGIYVHSSDFPNGKCICSENIIEIFDSI